MSLTLFQLDDLARVNLHLRLPVSLILAQPPVTGEHVIFAMNWNHDLNAVQEPASIHAVVGVSNDQAIDLEKGWRKNT